MCRPRAHSGRRRVAELAALAVMVTLLTGGGIVAASPPLSPAPAPALESTGTSVTVTVLESVSISVDRDSTTIVSNVPGGFGIRECMTGSQSRYQLHARKAACATVRLDSPGRFTVPTGADGSRDELVPNY